MTSSQKTAFINLHKINKNKNECCKTLNISKKKFFGTFHSSNSFKTEILDVIKSKVGKKKGSAIASFNLHRNMLWYEGDFKIYGIKESSKNYMKVYHNLGTTNYFCSINQILNNYYECACIVSKHNDYFMIQTRMAFPFDVRIERK